MFAVTWFACWRNAALATTVLLSLLLAGCSKEKNTEPDGDLHPSTGRLVVVTTDYATGSITVVDPDSSYAVQTDVAPIHSDAVARVHDGLVYVINRFEGDNVQVLDPEHGFQTVRQFSVGPGTNPQDIAFLSEGRAYVSRAGSVSLLEVDPRDGTFRDEIPLAALADADGTPDMGRMFFRDPYLYVAIARIDTGSGTYEPVAPSYLAVVDTRDNRVVDVDLDVGGVQGIVLGGLNPIAPMVWDETTSCLLVPCAGSYTALDAGIDKVDLDARESIGWLITEEELGGNMIDFALTGGDRGYATVSDMTFITSLVAFDRTSGTSLGAVYSSDAYELADVLVTSRGHVIVCDRDTTAPGLRIFEAGTGEAVSEIQQPLSTGLPPFEIIALEP